MFRSCNRCALDFVARFMRLVADDGSLFGFSSLQRILRHFFVYRPICFIFLPWPNVEVMRLRIKNGANQLINVQITYWFYRCETFSRPGTMQNNPYLLCPSFKSGRRWQRLNPGESWEIGFLLWFAGSFRRIWMALKRSIFKAASCQQIPQKSARLSGKKTMLLILMVYFFGNDKKIMTQFLLLWLDDKQLLLAKKASK